MQSLKKIIESVFSDKINTTYAQKLQGRVQQKPDDFDPDALHLGVLHELTKYKTFKKALAVAMETLSKDENAYNEVDDYGRMHPSSFAEPSLWAARPATYQS